MRIVHLYKDYHPPVHGGIEQTLERMAQRQVAAGHDVTALVSASGGRRTVTERLAGVRVIRVAEWARVASAPICPTMALELAKLEADVWHLHFPNPTGELSWLLAPRAGAMVVTYHSDIVRQKLALTFYRPFLRAVLARADLIMPTSLRYVDHSDVLRPLRDRCREVPLGVEVERFSDLTRFAPRAAALRARYGTPLTLFVGRLRYYKGLHVMLAAMAKTPGTLAIVGDGPEEAGLKAQASALGLGGRVVFVGPVSDDELLAHFAAADVGVLPSTLPSEAFGVAMVEMLAAGVPAVCTELGTGTSVVNRDGETGLVVPPNDPGALAGAIARIVGDPALRARFSANARRHAREHFSTAAMMRGVMAVYEEALQRRAA